MKENSNTIDQSNKKSPINRSRFIKSTVLITALTLIFGVLSYALIAINNQVMQLTISESMWCGFAMSLAVLYYLYQKSKSIE